MGEVKLTLVLTTLWVNNSTQGKFQQLCVELKDENVL